MMSVLLSVEFDQKSMPWIIAQNHQMHGYNMSFFRQWIYGVSLSLVPRL